MLAGVPRPTLAAALGISEKALESLPKEAVTIGPVM